MKLKLVFVLILSVFSSLPVLSESKFIQTPYKNQKVVFDFYFDEPEKIASALYWIRSWMNPLLKPPYNEAPEFLDVVVMIHGTELVTLVKSNEKKYQDIVDRMKYYAGFGFKFKVCEIAAHDFNYGTKDFQDFVEVIPSAMNELVHWQIRGYGLITPRILSKKYSTEEIR
ncbi:MAG: DsrE family protein [Gammaproteobacteria bacterium]|nr:DsrE family protein [Gammaproteobacteria bacterium]